VIRTQPPGKESRKDVSSEVVGAQGEPSEDEGKPAPASGPTRIRGSVTNVATGQREARVKVTASRLQGGKDLTDGTNINGEFRFDKLPIGDWRIVASASGFATVCSRDCFAEVHLATGEQLDNVPLKIVPAAALEVKVLSAIGKALPTAKVFVTAGRNKKGEWVASSSSGLQIDRSESLSIPHVALSYADGAGICRFEGLEAGYYDLAAVAPGFARKPLAGVPTGTKDSEFRLEPEVRVEGKVTLSGTGASLAGAVVAVTCEVEGMPRFGGTVLTNASGEYGVGSLPRKSRLTIQASSGECESSVYELVFQGSADVHKRDLTVFNDRAVKGRVIDSFTRQPIDNVEVWARNRLGTKRAATSSGNGMFAIETGIASHEIQLRKPGVYKDSPWIPAVFRREAKMVLLPNVELALGIPVSGRVTDKVANLGVPEAAVRALPVGKQVLDPDLYPHTLTDRKGDFRLEAVPPGDWYLSAEKVGYRAGYYGVLGTTAEFHHPVASISPGSPLENVLIALVPIPRVSLEGNVVDPERTPVPGATVSMEGIGFDGQEPVSPVETDPDGKFRFENVPIGRYTLTAEHQDYWPSSSEPVDLAPGAKHDPVEIAIEKKESRVISGRAYTLDGQPVSGAKVWCLLGRMESLYAARLLTSNGFVSLKDFGSGFEEGPEGTYRLEETGTDGTYRIEGLRSGKYSVGIVTSDGISDVKYDVDAGAQGVDFQVSGGAGIRGTVFFSDGQTPCSQFTLQLKAVSSDPAAFELADLGKTGPFSDNGQVFQSQGGTFEIDGIPNGIYTLHAESENHGEASIFGVETSDMQEPPDLQIVLEGGQALIGTVFDPKGAFVEGATVRLGEVVKRTPLAGRFEFHGLSPDTYILVISHPDFAVKTIPDIVVQEGRDRNLGKIVLTGGGILEGQVKRSSGEGIGGYVIQLEPSDGPPASLEKESDRFLAGADGEGFFRFNRLSGGTYRLTLRQTEVSRDRAFSRYGRPVQSRQVGVTEGSATHVDLVVDEGVQLSGTVLVGGKPLARSTVVLYPRFKTDVEELVALTDQWGNYSFDGVPAGQYEAVVAEFSPDDARPVQLTVPEQPSLRHDFKF